MATAASTVIGRVSTLLQDTTNVRWPQSELLDYLNDGQREIALYKPSASLSGPINFTLNAGSKQTLPLGALSLVDVVRNMGSGDTPGNAIRVVAREVLDAQVPEWHTLTGTAVKHYTYSTLDPTHFYVYPAASGKVIEIIYGVTPTDAVLVGQNTNIRIDDIWSPALVNYMCYRAYSKDAEYASNAQAAASYYQAFIAQMTGKTAAEQAANPNISMGNFNPNVPGMK